MRPLLSRPYQLDTSAADRVRRALLFGGFVLLFLLIFQPFGLGLTGARLPWLALGYGAVCTGVMLLLNVLVPRLAKGWFQEAQWTVGREMAWTSVNVLLIGLTNALYTAGIGLAPWALATILNFTFYTVAVGLFPILVSVLLNESRLHREYARRSAEVDRQLQANLQHQAAAPPPPEPPSVHRIRIPAEGQADDLELEADALCFIRSADNYIEVYHRRGPHVERTVLRGSLKAVEEALRDDPRFMRCHKSHLVDLRKVQRVSGNAQGLKLHLEGLEEAVPVSRQLTAAVRERLAARP